MRILYLDDSGKIHPNDPAKVVVFAGFSVDEGHWHDLRRRLVGTKANHFPHRGNPNDWEIKSSDFLTPNNWNRAKKRRFCYSLVQHLLQCGCHVYAVSLEKAKANDALEEAKFVPLAFHRLLAKFHHEVCAGETTGTVVCDWSTHEMDRHLTNCISSMIVTRKMHELRGGITYGSSQALPPLQVADLIAGTLRRSLEGQKALDLLAYSFRMLRYDALDKADILGYPVDSVCKVF